MAVAMARSTLAVDAVCSGIVVKSLFGMMILRDVDKQPPSRSFHALSAPEMTG